MSGQRAFPCRVDTLRIAFVPPALTRVRRQAVCSGLGAAALVSRAA